MATVESREENIKNVIDAALWCFENVGIEGTTRVLIAKHAGVTVRSIQRYFGTLDHLIIEATGVYVRRLNEYMYSELNRLKRSNATGYELLIVFLRMHLKLFNPDMPSPLVVHEMELYFLKHHIPLATLYQKLFDKKSKTTIMSELFYQGIADGSIKKTTDIDVIYAYLVTTFPAMIIRIQMMENGFEDIDSKITKEMLFDKYIEILENQIKA